MVDALLVKAAWTTITHTHIDCGVRREGVDQQRATNSPHHLLQQRINTIRAARNIQARVGLTVGLKFDVCYPAYKPAEQESPLSKNLEATTRCTGESASSILSAGHQASSEQQVRLIKPHLHDHVDSAVQQRVVATCKHMDATVTSRAFGIHTQVPIRFEAPRHSG